MSLPVEGYELKRISSKSFEHPADRAATAALQSIPGLDMVIRKLIELRYEHAIRQYFLGSSVRLGPDQLGDVYHAHARAYATLDMDTVPDLYLTNTSLIIDNAAAIGAKKPIVVVHSGLVKLLDTEHQRALFAHEAGHVLSDHGLYGTALQILIRLTTLPGLPLPLGALRTALLEWYRAAELSCDRAAALVTRDPVVVCRLLMAIAGGAEAERLDLDEFMHQGAEYNEGGSGWERLTRLLMNMNLTHPMPVRRIHELMKWVKSGDYDRIVGGSYVSRDEPVRPRAEAGEAVAHYTERFKNTLRDAGESIGDLGSKLSDWLHALEEDDESDEGEKGDG
jgi:Zn-dependent protease with chaperone function